MNPETIKIQTTQENELNQVNFKNAIVSSIELKDGTNTQIITIFNSNEINFEEMVIGINTAVYRQSEFYNNIKSIQNTFSSINNGNLKPFATYRKNEIATNTKFN